MWLPPLSTECGSGCFDSSRALHLRSAVSASACDHERKCVGRSTHAEDQKPRHGCDPGLHQSMPMVAICSSERILPRLELNPRAFHSTAAPGYPRRVAFRVEPASIGVEP